MTVSKYTASAAMKNLKGEIRAVGLKPAIIMQSLPDWWEDAQEHLSGVVEIRGFIARHFGLEIDPNGRLHSNNLPNARFKTTKGTNVQDIAAPRAFAATISGLVAKATSIPWSGQVPQANELREHIVSKANWVGFNELLDYCWSIGIPVICVPDLPAEGSKMEGQVMFCIDRPVIFISKNPDFPAWNLFVLAHELGHLARGHLDFVNGESIIDEKIDEKDVSDQQEQEANEYALELLTGDGKKEIKLNRLFKATALAPIAQQFGRDRSIDPGHAILNLAKNSNKNLWPLVTKTLGLLETKGDASKIGRDTLRLNTSSELLRDDSVEFLEKLNLL